MSEEFESRILSHLKSNEYRPKDTKALARELQIEQSGDFNSFRSALRELMHEGRVVMGAGGTIVLPNQQQPRSEFTGTYRHNRRGFGFVVPTDPSAHEDLYIPEGQNGG